MDDMMWYHFWSQFQAVSLKWYPLNKTHPWGPHQSTWHVLKHPHIRVFNWCCHCFASSSTAAIFGCAASQVPPRPTPLHAVVSPKRKGDRSCDWLQPGTTMIEVVMGFMLSHFYMLMLMLWCYICSIGLFFAITKICQDFFWHRSAIWSIMLCTKIKEQSHCAEFVENPIIYSTASDEDFIGPLLLPDQVRESLSKDSSLTAAISDSGVFVLGSCQLSGMWQLCCWKILMGKGKKMLFAFGRGHVGEVEIQAERVKKHQIPNDVEIGMPMRN